MAEHYAVVIVGAGQSGTLAAMTLRNTGFSGSILMIGEEPALPALRNASSGAHRLGSILIEKIPLHEASGWAHHGIDVMLGTPVLAVDQDTSTLLLADGASIHFERCIMARDEALQ